MKSSKKIQPLITGVIIILILFTAPGALGSEDPPQVTDLIVRPGSNEVELTVQGSIEYGYFPLSDPDRLVFDFPGAVLHDLDEEILNREVEGACFDSVRLSRFSLDPPITRLVLYLSQPASATVNFSPVSGRLVIEAVPDGWGMDLLSVPEPVSEIPTSVPATVEPVFIEEEIPPVVTTAEPIRFNQPTYNIAFDRSEVIVRLPEMTADSIIVNQLRFPDRLHIRMLTDGPIDGTRPRFDQLDTGNIWNAVAKQWRSYADRDGLGVIDLTIYLYSDIGYTQSVGMNGVPEIRLFALPQNTVPIIIDGASPTVEIEVASYNDDTEEPVEVEPDIVEEPTAEETSGIEETISEPEPVIAEEEIIEESEPEIIEQPEEEIVEVEVLAETTIEEQIDEEVVIIPEIPEVTETLEVIENAVFIASAIIPSELTPSIELAGFSVPAGGIPQLPLAISRNNLLTNMSADSGIMVMRVGDVVVMPVRNLVRASVGNPAVALVNVYSTDEVLVTAMGAGNTTLLTWENNRGHISREIWVYEATAAQEEEIEALIDDDNISVSILMGGTSPGVILEGSVETEEEMLRAGAIAALFASEDRVTNLIEVSDPRQVLVKVRVVELDRRALDEHLSQLNASMRTDNDDFTLGIITNLLDPENPGGGLLNNRVRPGIINGEAEDMVYDPIDMMLNELESLRQANVLSEPNVVSMSGHPAHFRVGGEIPYTYVNSEGVNVVEFKEFGIQVDMTPHVDSQGNIFMNIEPTVRTIDWALAIGGIPGFRTREMITNVQMKSGETLVIGGLIQHEITEVISEVPFLSDIPILGELFRSKRFNENETELVIFITPYILNGNDAEEIVGVYIDHPSLEDRD